MKHSTLLTLARIYAKQGAARIASIMKHMGASLERALEVMRLVVRFAKVNLVF